MPTERSRKIRSGPKGITTQRPPEISRNGWRVHSRAAWAARRLGRDDLLVDLTTDPDPAVREELDRGIERSQRLCHGTGVLLAGVVVDVAYHHCGGLPARRDIDPADFPKRILPRIAVIAVETADGECPGVPGGEPIPPSVVATVIWIGYSTP